MFWGSISAGNPSANMKWNVNSSKVLEEILLKISWANWPFLTLLSTWNSLTHTHTHTYTHTHTHRHTLTVGTVGFINDYSHDNVTQVQAYLMLAAKTNWPLDAYNFMLMMPTLMDTEWRPYPKAPVTVMTMLIRITKFWSSFIKCTSINHFTNICFPELLYYAKQTKELCKNQCIL